jgi:K+-sensing histidine kinase KdpD
MPVSMRAQIKMPKLPQRESGNAPRSQTERVWLTAGGIAAFVVLLVGYFFFISPQRAQTADVGAQIATAKDANTVLQQRINALGVQNKDLQRYEDELAQAELALPTTSEVSDFLRTLQSLGNTTLTDVTALTVGQPVNVNAASAVQPTAASEEGAAASSTSAAGTPAGGATTAAPAAAVYSLPITATVSGSPTALAKFLDQLQSVQPRAVLITQLTETTGTAGTQSGATLINLTMTAFVAPSSPTVTASLAAGAATPSATASG